MMAGVKSGTSEPINTTRPHPCRKAFSESQPHTGAEIALRLNYVFEIPAQPSGHLLPAAAGKVDFHPQRVVFF